ncbi:MAG: polysaccharide deacetylase family protein [Candidatus Aenigmarchaeota archaeon]|nr:polysaccharide deacetylase family protein [Candidatus Aenigmarchaeota archaeon]
MQPKTVLLTFDLEEFDLPLEYGIHINYADMFSISVNGCLKILNILRNYKINSTFFITGFFGENRPKLIKKINKLGHEIALHGYKHDQKYSEMKKEDILNDIKRGKKILEKICRKKVYGFRSPRMEMVSFEILKKTGLKYDSSLHPTYVPGRYNNFTSPRDIKSYKGFFEVPISVTPVVRLPFTWVWFRNLGLNYAKICSKLSFLNQSFINIYFHPWEFVNVKKFKIPMYIKNKTGNTMIKLLKYYIEWCLENEFRFNTIINFIS